VTGEPSPEDLAVVDFAVVALASGPNFDALPTMLRNMGYTEPTSDPQIVSRPSGTMLAGSGVINFQGSPAADEPNAFVLYVRSAEPSRLGNGLSRMVQRIYPGTQPYTGHDSVYWDVTTQGGRNLTLVLTDKAREPYADCILVACVDRPPSTLGRH
jgi:hypothetical protein